MHADIVENNAQYGLSGNIGTCEISANALVSYSLPVRERISFYGQLGASFMDTDYRHSNISVNERSGTQTQESRWSNQSWHWLGGVGLAVNLDERISLQFGYTRLFALDKRHPRENRDDDEPDVGLIQGGILWRF